MSNQPILRVIAKMFIPFLMLFALYVQFHGDFGPGGGFQAGVIFAAALVLYALIFGTEQAKRVVHPRALQLLVACGILLYAGTGVAGIVLGGNFLDYGALDHHNPVHGQHLGILLVELGVGITVTTVMTSTFFIFSARKKS
ncbi:MAG: Na(+)/H(+) antiporter subunit B [Gemmatimonadetes bacterium]|jgi:multicomponent Na+:H+ antiporter subunit B|nr:Na(+)/H(+) antiporter subunit B [Gemmatimonadota bacterium]MBT5142983.1 Na(+)/H(+) antiporter subunit B [Gemmatimonadota bacterium]MBT5588249.1 Na(+)/H(+) antiporter subunit B [Gemmatimonadota bacterium]MBT5962648.1 Na(+)/H(+) antiporter subunit B [Gemmatimonadota bacterium]MBT6629151.1 Na(+)/H(+) antiporter subunit B [Gemmatimonadota bacterium]